MEEMEHKSHRGFCHLLEFHAEQPPAPGQALGPTTSNLLAEIFPETSLHVCMCLKD